MRCHRQPGQPVGPSRTMLGLWLSLCRTQEATGRFTGEGQQDLAKSSSKNGKLSKVLAYSEKIVFFVT